MKRRGIAIVIVLAFVGGPSLLEDKKSVQQQAFIALAEAGGYEAHNTPGYNGAWWATVEVPGCKNRVGLRSEEAPRDHVPTRFFVVRVGPMPQESLRSYISDDATAATLRQQASSEALLDC